jgi:phosphoserine phosphatase
MPKPFAAFDVDGTIFKSSLAEKVIDGCIDAGMFKAESFNKVFENKRRWQRSNNEGVYQAYLHRLVGSFVIELAGVDVEQFNEVTASMIEHHTVRKFAFPRQLMTALQTSHHLLAISGSPNILVQPFLHDLDVQTTFGSTFAVEDGKFTGEAQTVGDKATLLRELVAKGEITQLGSVAIGDTFSDISMLKYAATPIAFNASRTLTNYAKEFNWLRVNEVKDQITALEWDDLSKQYIEQDSERIIDSLRAA